MPQINLSVFICRWGPQPLPWKHGGLRPGIYIRDKLPWKLPKFVTAQVA
jgi:hypothetical protein